MQKTTNYITPFKKIGTILNFLFIINWLFLFLFYLDARKYDKTLVDGYFVAAIIIPIVTLLSLSIYISLFVLLTKKYKLPEQKKTLFFYLLIIIIFAFLSILSTLLILLACEKKFLHLGFTLALTFSIIFGIIAIIFDSSFMFLRIKWDHHNEIKLKTLENDNNNLLKAELEQEKDETIK